MLLCACNHTRLAVLVISYLTSPYTLHTPSIGNSSIMVLVGYSDSDSSDTEALQKKKIRFAPNENSRKLAFQKVVDGSDPHKILVNLPEPSKSTKSVEEEEATEPVTKKAKLGSSSFSGFNSILPAPKKSSATGRGSGDNGIQKSGLGSGTNLRTGATPGFSREALAVKQIDDNSQTTEEEARNAEINVPSSNNSEPLLNSALLDHAKAEPKLQGNSMMFKPLSVARKTKKKSSTVIHGESQVLPPDSRPSRNSEVASKISLFSSADIEITSRGPQISNGQYQSIVYKPSYPPPTLQEFASSEYERVEDSAMVNTANIHSSPKISNDTPQSLDTIAEDLNLSASARRQLLGRQRHDPSQINLVNFNIDQEYAANELLRQAGEQVQHNPVRAIAPGKHSLKQLVNAASTQKDALEEHFATGKRNKKEAGSKYGW